jgi:hypothetical protein
MENSGKLAAEIKVKNRVHLDLTAEHPLDEIDPVG